ncbi:GNAT family N-acetyltransferase [Deinococcus humi]|uniref:Aminoglycoside 6'-N-acetyltransferase n=1 Tax=Deinococcus humi TaxID=662880 RepID=A0A7W8JRK8_9DEIO|nr:GNAT family N-acetyltransferase [Deinococcus humi]MBB5361568.1 aminoglycoside 6'-N-acetyltransferase [Deinococcus humi]GGO20754.1 MFS transporter [Deinococcus humi]
MRITFELLSEAHLPTLTRWLPQPHVRAFWDDRERDVAAVRAPYCRPGREVPGFVFSLDGWAAGFIQSQHITPGHGFYSWAASDGETWAIDVLIGDAELTGQGWGPQVIRTFVGKLRAERPALRRVLIDPASENTRAVRACVKVGFLPLAVLEGEDGPVRLMRLDLSD